MVMVGCVESGDNGRFHLVRATEPEALEERMPEEPAADTPLGAQTIRPIGTLDEFGVPARTGHKVWRRACSSRRRWQRGSAESHLDHRLSDRCES